MERRGKQKESAVVRNGVTFHIFARTHTPNSNTVYYLAEHTNLAHSYIVRLLSSSSSSSYTVSNKNRYLFSAYLHRALGSTSSLLKKTATCT